MHHHDPGLTPDEYDLYKRREARRAMMKLREMGYEYNGKGWASDPNNLAHLDEMRNAADNASVNREDTARQRRERRRYEIAKECIAALAPRFQNPVADELPKVASWAVQWADSLLAELEKA